MTESFIDELAAAAKHDPVAYRRALLNKTPRAKAVIELAAEKAGWGQPLPKGIGRGVSLQFAFATYMAQVAEVEVSRDGAVRVRRVVCAVDCGTVINPDTVRAQIQGAIIFGITAALYGEITLKDGRVEQTNFDSYQILRMNEVPAIEVHIVQSSDPPGGMGEAGTSAIVPAVTNAIFAATGKRLRKPPTAWLHEERSSVFPYGASDQRTMFTPERIAIEKLDGTLVAERYAPRDSFAGHQMSTPWDPLHRAYFNGEAMWTYLTTPFLGWQTNAARLAKRRAYRRGPDHRPILDMLMVSIDVSDASFT